MTMPHLMNCNHSDDGWCLDCVKELHDKYEHSRDKCERKDAMDKYLRGRFKDVVPGLCSGSWDDIWERVRDKFKEDK